MNEAPKIIRVDAEGVMGERLEPAARQLRRGGLVAFPTETVYGLGANALDADAVERIFAAKQRPPTNPIIVHVADIDAAREVVRDWPDAAQRLADAFWPGPLTLILPKKDTVPDTVSGGLDTVGVRMPAHPVALELIRLAGVPVAAPSANRYTEVSPTRAEHVVDSLGGAVDVVVDAGATQVGVESTVLTLAGEHPEILRPGMITCEQLEAVVPDVSYGGEQTVEEDKTRPSPGLARKHYAPRADLRLVDDVDTLVALTGAAGDVAWVVLEPFDEERKPVGRVVVMGREPSTYAERLYAVLRDLDARQVGTIIVERPPSGEPWRAIHDRLNRAAQ